MAIQIIDDPYRNQMQSLSRSAGKGLSSGINAILSQKLESLQRQPIVNEVQGLGIDPRTATFISRLSPKDQLEALQRYRPQQQGYQPQGIDMMQGQQPYQMSPQYGQQQVPQQQQRFVSPLVGGGGLASQKAINAQNAPFLKGLGKAVDNAEAAISSLQRMKALLDTGKVASGLGGQITPAWLQSEETQLFDKESNTLAGILSGQQGVPTGYKIKFALTQKPNVNQKAGTQRKLIESLLEEAEKVAHKAEIRDMLIAQNGGEQPSNIETLINQIYKNSSPNRIGKRESVQESENEPEQAGSNQNQDESILGAGVRGIARTASRIGESVIGTPGDIAATGLGIGNYLTGGAIPSYGQVQEALPALNLIPTSEQLKNLAGKVTSGYTNPQSGTEETVDSAVQTFASLFGPSVLKAPLVKNIAKVVSPNAAQKVGSLIMPFSGTSWKRALGLTAAGEAGAGLASSLGYGPLGQAVGKLGAMSAAGTIGGRRQLENIMKESYAEARDSNTGILVHEANSINGNNVANKINNIKKDLSRTAIPNKDLVEQIISKVENGFKNSNSAYGSAEHTLIPANEALAQKIALNDWLELGYSPRTPGELYLPENARPWVNKVAKVLREELKDFGDKHPSFGKPFALGEDIYQGLALADSISDFGLKHGASLSTDIFSVLLKKLVFEGLIPVAGKGIGPIYAAIMENGELRKHYAKMLESAAKNSLPEFKRSAAAFDKEALKIERKKK